MTMTDLSLTLTASVLVVGATIAYCKILTPKLPLPPGPPRFPLIGSLLALPSDEPNWEWFSRLSRQTGSDVVHFDVLGQHTIVINSRQAAVEILDRRSGFYSDRPHMTMASELAGWDKEIGMAKYTRAREIRRWLLKSMDTKAMEEWKPQLEQEALRFLTKLMRTPEQFSDHIKHTAGATVARLTYGYQPKDEHDELIEAAQRNMESFAKATTPGAFAVDLFPILKYIPWAGFHRTAAVWREEIRFVVDRSMDFVQDQTTTILRNKWRKGVAEPSFVSRWLESAGPKDDISLIPFTASSLFAAASDTTVAAVSTLFLAMLHYPDVQRKAQAEIDRVVGTDRLPNLSDRDSLPHIEGVYKELFRWIPITPIGLPHRYSGEKDDEFRGMRIPVGSMVIANIYAFLQDPEVYKNPKLFNPERYNGPMTEPNPEDVTFGFGRRRCPGIPVAQASVWLSIALVLATSNIEPLVGEDGKTELPPLEYVGTTIRHPKLFRCRVTPRSDKARRMVEGIFV